MKASSRQLVQIPGSAPFRPISPYLKLYLSPRLLSSTASIRSRSSQHTIRTISASIVSLRSFHSSPSRFVPAPTTPNSKDVATSTPAEKSVSTTTKPKGYSMKRMWAAVKKEALHYWHGTKLLGKEIRISARIQGRLLAGKKLTRREHRQVC